MPYYTELFSKVGFNAELMKSVNEINIIPFLTKDIIRENFDKLISTQKVKEGYYVATTGGTTGEPLRVLLDYTSVFKENAFVNHFRSKLGYQESDRLATFRGVEFGDKLWKFNPMQNELIFSPFKITKKNLKLFVSKINSFKPAFLNGYLSSLYYFAELLFESNLKLKVPLKGIFLISENIDNEHRSFIENFFRVKSSTFYGHSERCVIAEEVLPNKYVFDPYYGYTELIELNENVSEIVGTGFLNYMMPLIRYRTKDICQVVGPGLVSITGRWDTRDFLLGINNEKVYHSAFNFHSEIFKNVVNYQIIQIEKGKVDLFLVINGKFDFSEISLIRREIDKKTKGVIEFNIKITDHLQLSPRGKYKRFISNISAINS